MAFSNHDRIKITGNIDVAVNNLTNNDVLAYDSATKTWQNKVAPGGGTVADGSITTVKLSDNAVTNVKLDSSTQATLSSVAGKYVKPGGGIPSSDMAVAVQTSLGKADTALQSVTKTDVNLGNVDNTSDASKNSATATLTNKTISGANNTLTNIPESAITNLTTDLSAKLDSTQKGAANGVASLDNTGKVPSAQLPASSGNTPDATTTSKGIVQLAGDLAGTADTPTVPGLAAKAADSSVVHLTGTETVTGTKSFSSTITALKLAVTNIVTNSISGATTARFVGVMDYSPNTGSYLAGDFGVSASAGNIFICKTSGTPGTWVQAGANLQLNSSEITSLRSSAWGYDEYAVPPFVASTSSATFGLGILYITPLDLYSPVGSVQFISISCYQSSLGSGATNPQILMGVYPDTGALARPSLYSGPISGTTGTLPANATGTRTVTFSTPKTFLSGRYWLAFMLRADAVYTTQPGFSGITPINNFGLTNLDVSSGVSRGFAYTGGSTSATALPTSVTVLPYVSSSWPLVALRSESNPG